VSIKDRISEGVEVIKPDGKLLEYIRDKNDDKKILDIIKYTWNHGYTITQIIEELDTFGFDDVDPWDVRSITDSIGNTILRKEERRDKAIKVLTDKVVLLTNRMTRLEGHARSILKAEY